MIQGTPLPRSAALETTCVGPASAQQLDTTTTKMEVDLPEVVAEVVAAFNQYKQALVWNDASVLSATFRDDHRTIFCAKRGKSLWLWRNRGLSEGA